MQGQRGRPGHTGCRSNGFSSSEEIPGVNTVVFQVFGEPCLPKKVEIFRSGHNPRMGRWWDPVDADTDRHLQPHRAVCSDNSYEVSPFPWTLRRQPVSDPSKSLRSARCGPSAFPLGGERSSSGKGIFHSFGRGVRRSGGRRALKSLHSREVVCSFFTLLKDPVKGLLKIKIRLFSKIKFMFI